MIKMVALKVVGYIRINLIKESVGWDTHPTINPNAEVGNYRWENMIDVIKILRQRKFPPYSV